MTSISCASELLGFRFEKAKLRDLANVHRESFLNGKPFPHVVIPNFLPDDVARALAEEFPDPDQIHWKLEGPGDARHTDNKYIEKLCSSNEESFPPLTRCVMHEFNSGTFLDFISGVSGHKALVPDPWFGGCGLHSTGRGGRLMIHADSSRHPNPKLHQILNMIYYITPGWQDAWGGHLELWDTDAKALVKSVKPEFNSMLLFFTGSRCFHGHPMPLTSPTGIRRNSLATYYYTTDRAIDETYAGHREYVKWIPTNKLDANIALKRKIRRVLDNNLPHSLMQRINKIRKKFN